MDPGGQARDDDGAPGDGFGFSVALSGDTALVGARFASASGPGAVYVFTRNGEVWSEQARLTASDGAELDQFGQSVALSGDTALIGASGVNGSQGAAYVFTRSGGIWSERTKLTATDGATFDNFGHSVALAGETALVGAFTADVGGNTNQGAVYVFTGAGEDWSEQAKLIAADGQAIDQFGHSVALAGETALVGARFADVDGNVNQGAAYVFIRDGEAWSEQARLTAADGAAFDDFGTSVALVGDTALVGAWQADPDGSTNQGAAYVFTRSGEVWSEQARLTAADGAEFDQFGTSVALAADLALVGAVSADAGGNSNQGAAYVFSRSDGAWNEQAKLIAADGAAGDNLGASAALAGDTALVGAPGGVFPSVPGAAYVFLDFDLPPDFGTIEGTVQGLGTCNSEVMPLVGATVEITGAEETWTLEAGNGGFYQTFLPDSESPVTITVTAPGHLSATVEGIEFSGGDTVVQDFDLILDAPCATVEPEALTVELPAGTSEAFELTVGNADGGAALDWTVETAVPPFGFEVDCDGDPGLILHDDGTVDNGYSGDPSLIGQVVFVDRFTPGSYPAFFRAVCVAFTTGGPESLDFEIVAFDDDGPNGRPGTELGALPASATGIPDLTGTPVWFSYDISSLNLSIDSGSIYIGARWAPSNPNVFIAADQSTSNPPGFAGGYWWRDDTGEWLPMGIIGSFMNYRALFVRAVENLGGCHDPSTIAWLSVAPGSGSAPAGGSASVEVTVDATGLEAGEHRASLCIATSDGNNPLVVVPVTLTVTGDGGGPWGEQAKIAAADGAAQNFFGTAVAVAGDTALVGARGNGLFQGAAYILARAGDAWSEETKLTASDGVSNEQLGSSVALSADTAVVGAPFAVVDGGFNQGAAYVFVRSGEGWVEQAKLTAADGAAFDTFGNAVALSGDTVLVGALDADIGDNASQGAVYVFTRTGETWSQQAKLALADGGANSQFGSSVALSGSTALAGAPPADVDGTIQGAAYVFTRSDGVWSQQARLTASDGAQGDQLGTSVALLGDTAVVGAWAVDVGGNANQGAAYVFSRSGDMWTEQTKLTASDGAADELFGSAVAVAGDTALVGALATVDGNTRQGAAYVFSRSGDMWTEQTKLTASDGAAEDRFGSTGAVALSGDTALVGAPEADMDGNADQGAAYVFVSDEGAGAPGIDVDPGSLSITLTEDQIEIRSLTVTNLGGEPLDWEVTEGDGCTLPTWTSVDPSSGMVPAASSQGVAVTFDAGGLVPGDYDATLCLTSNDPAQPTTTVPLSLTVTDEPGPGVLEVDPQALDFGKVPAGSTETLGFNVSNAPAPGAGDLELATLELSSGAPDFVLSGGTCEVGTVLPPEGTCTVEVTFQPVSSGNFAGAVIVATVDEQSATVELSGTAPTDPPVIDVEPDSLSSTLPEGETEIQTLTVANLGEETLEWHVPGEAAAGPFPDAGDETTITHSASLEIQTPNTVACQTPPFTRENHYLRAFTLNDFGLTEGLVVTEVTFGVEILDITVPIQVNLYTLEGELVFDNLTSIGSATVELAPQNLTLVTVPVAGFAPTGSTLVVEILSPDLLGEGRFFPGSNDLGESAPSYWAASSCALDEPTTYEDAGFTGVHLVMTVTGDEPGDCTLPSWAGVDPLSGSVPGGGSQSIDVTFDATGQTPGDLDAVLCIGSNDPKQPLTTVPLALTVTGGGESFTAMALEVDPGELASDGNGIFEPGEQVEAVPTWRNDGDVPRSLSGTASSFTGPEGAVYTLTMDEADYGLVEPGETASCLDTGVCYQLGVEDPAVRPATHWEATFDETLSDTAGTTKTWTLHIGDSFTDVPSSNLFYPSVETLLHHGVTGGCTDTEYCPTAANTRDQMPVFVLKALMGPDYQPPDCVEGDEVFHDVPAGNIFCPWIEELANRGVVSGCGRENYCPNAPVTRAQMAIFLLRSLEGSDYEPPACTGQFIDVPCPSLFADWIEELFAREITGGCSNQPPRYCPANPVNREQMAAFIGKAFGLTLYGP